MQDRCPASLIMDSVVALPDGLHRRIIGVLHSIITAVNLAQWNCEAPSDSKLFNCQFLLVSYLGG